MHTWLNGPNPQFMCSKLFSTFIKDMTDMSSNFKKYSLTGQSSSPLLMDSSKWLDWIECDFNWLGLLYIDGHVIWPIYSMAKQVRLAMKLTNNRYATVMSIH